MSFSFSEFSSALRDGRAISPEDVLACAARSGRMASSRGPRPRSSSSSTGGARPSPEWRDFVIEAVTDGREPEGAEGLCRRGEGRVADRRGRQGWQPIGPARVELVVKILETALNAPACTHKLLPAGRVGGAQGGVLDPPEHSASPWLTTRAPSPPPAKTMRRSKLDLGLVDDARADVAVAPGRAFAAEDAALDLGQRPGLERGRAR